MPRVPEAVNDTDTERDVCKKQSALQGEGPQGNGNNVVSFGNFQKQVR